VRTSQGSHWPFEISSGEFDDINFDNINVNIQNINVKNLVEDIDIKFNDKNKQLNNEIYTKKYQKLINTSDDYFKPNVTSEQNTVIIIKCLKLK
jgi:hypothetical protein